MSIIDNLENYYETTNELGYSREKANIGISSFQCFFLIYCYEKGLLKGQEIGKGENLENILHGYLSETGIIDIVSFYNKKYNLEIKENYFNKQGLEIVEWFYIGFEEENEEDIGAINYLNSYIYVFLQDRGDEYIGNIFSIEPTKDNYLKLKDFLDSIDLFI